MAMASSETFKTPIGRFSYVQGMFSRVAKKTDAGETIMKDGKPVTEQQCTLIFDNSADRSVFEKAIQDVIIEQWGEKGLERAKAGLIRLPFLKGDGKEARNKKSGEINPGLGADKWFIRVATRMEAPVRFRSASIPATYGQGDDQIKSGDYGFAVLHAYAWHNDKNGDGVSFGIDYLQKTRAGESLGGSGGVNVDDVFEQVEDSGEAPASTQGGAGAGGLFG
ncbi:hypothetical protein XM25_00795 [Devosia sp. H5989]|nr:hypothetical protein XM25_00795 [Devosia sp. H5989]